MFRASRRVSVISIVAAIALAATAPSGAEPVPQPPPSPPAGPLPVPYPDPPPPPTPECPYSLCPKGAAAGSAPVGAGRHQANIKFGDMTLEVHSFSLDDTRQEKDIRKRRGRASSDGDMIGAKPRPSGSATLVVERGALATGKYIPTSQIVIGGRTYDLEGVEVTGCTNLADGTDSCTLTYQGLRQ